MTHFPPKDAKTYFLNLKLIHAALIAGLVLFMLLALFLNASKLICSIQQDGVILILVLALTGILLPVSFVIHRPILKLNRSPNLIRKMQQQYQAICLARWALAEGAALFSLVIFLITGNLVFIFIALICIVAMIVNRASPQQFESYFSDM